MINSLLAIIHQWDIFVTAQLGSISRSGLLYTSKVAGVSPVYWVWIICLASIVFVYAYSGALVGRLQKRISTVVDFYHQFVIGLCVFGAAQVIKYTTLVERPYVLLGDIGVSIPASMNSTLSFPSAHAAVFMYATCLLWLYKTPVWLKILSVIMMLWITCSRVFVGYHFILDVCAGWLLGYIGFRIAKNYFEHPTRK